MTIDLEVSDDVRSAILENASKFVEVQREIDQVIAIAETRMLDAHERLSTMDTKKAAVEYRKAVALIQKDAETELKNIESRVRQQYGA